MGYTGMVYNEEGCWQRNLPVSVTTDIDNRTEKNQFKIGIPVNR